MSCRGADRGATVVSAAAACALRGCTLSASMKLCGCLPLVATAAGSNCCSRLHAGNQLAAALWLTLVLLLRCAVGVCVPLLLAQGSCGPVCPMLCWCWCALTLPDGQLELAALLPVEVQHALWSWGQGASVMLAQARQRLAAYGGCTCTSQAALCLVHACLALSLVWL